MVPGLRDGVKESRELTDYWHEHGLNLIVFSVDWRNGGDFKPKLGQLIELIDSTTKSGDTVSLVGVSAGGSAVLNAFIERRQVIHKAVNVLGRLRRGKQKISLRSFDIYWNRAYAQSVGLFENKEGSLTDDDRKKILTVRAKFGDELIPNNTVKLRGAFNADVPRGLHLLGVKKALTSPDPVIVFLKRKMSQNSD